MYSENKSPVSFEGGVREVSAVGKFVKHVGGRKGDGRREEGGKGTITTTGRLENARTCARVFSRGMPRGAAA